MASCGLDFGTSNTTLGVAAPGGTPHLVPLEARATTLPSAVFFDFDSAAMAVDQAAIDAYVADTEGRFMRALKSVLGTALIDDTPDQPSPACGRGQGEGIEGQS
jgi:hypothetical chaperone protein